MTVEFLIVVLVAFVGLVGYVALFVVEFDWFVGKLPPEGRGKIFV